MTVPVLKQGNVLIASIQAALSDAEMVQFRDDLVGKVGRFRATGVVIDIAALDVMDSFATRTLRGIADVARLRGARTVIVGIQAEVAMTMVQLGLSLAGITTALDLEEGLEMLGMRAAPEATGDGP
jgi:rsbT antagonist protein RsbS